MTNLEALGWGASWERHLAPHASQGLTPARITVEHRELYGFVADQGEGMAVVSGRLRHEAGSRADFPAVGDWVALSRSPGDNLAVIHAILPRRNRFSRKPPGRETEEQIIAANLDTLFLMTSLNRDLNRRRIERYLTAATIPHLQPVLLLTKSDLNEHPDDLLNEFRQVFGVPTHAISAVTGAGLEALLPYLGAGQTVAMVGSSGVGKSTLLNRLVGADWQTVREIRVTDDRGRHTTTHREMIRLPQGGLLIDNPGMRELQVWDEGADLDTTFDDIATLAAQCRFVDCRHESEPGCAVRTALEEGRLDEGRLESQRKLERELAYLETRRDARAERERKEQWKRIHRTYRKQQKGRDKR